LQEAAVQMREQHIGALVVTDGAANDHVAGVVTDRDMVVRALAKGANPVATTVGDVMTEGVMSVPQTTDVSDAMQAMSAMAYAGSR
jgi:CBS domain-containing protein